MPRADATTPTTIAAALALAGAALAQPAITIEVDQPTLLSGQSTSVTMFAGYGGTDYAVAVVQTDLLTTVGSEGWSDAMILDPMIAPGTTSGMAAATGWDGIIAAQLVFVGAGYFADPTNPIAFWSITYTAPGDVETPFEIDLSTMTSRYDVYVQPDSATSESRLADLVEGSATIRVIPAPASAFVLSLGALVAGVAGDDPLPKEEQPCCAPPHCSH